MRFRKEAPPRGTRVITPAGESVITGYNVPKDSITVRMEDGSYADLRLEDCEAQEDGSLLFTPREEEEPAQKPGEYRVLDFSLIPTDDDEDELPGARAAAGVVGDQVPANGGARGDATPGEEGKSSRSRSRRSRGRRGRGQAGVGDDGARDGQGAAASGGAPNQASAKQGGQQAGGRSAQQPQGRAGEGGSGEQAASGERKPRRRRRSRRPSGGDGGPATGGAGDAGGGAAGSGGE